MNVMMDFEQAPLLVIWEVTRACALACKHCRASAINVRDRMELNLDEGYQLLSDVAEMGTPLVVLTGGDPLQRDDLEDLIRHGKSCGLRMATIPATTERCTRERVGSLKEAGLDQMAVSIDAANAADHDGFRCVPGAFDRAMEAAKFAREAELPLQVNTVFGAWNADAFAEIAQLVTDLGVVFWEVFFLVPTGRGEQLEECSLEQYRTLFDQLEALSEQASFIIKVTEAPQYRAYLRWKANEGAGIDHEERAGSGIRVTRGGVNAGKGFCFVDHVGNVYPSGFLPLVAGNVRAQSITSLYRDSPLFRLLRDTTQLKGVCHWCDYRDMCGGSRARAFAVTGDYMAAEPSCVLGADMMKRHIEQVSAAECC